MKLHFSSLFASCLVLALTCYACADAPEYPVEPVITYEGVSSTEIFQSTSGIRDSITIFFSFTDGDGDLTGVDTNEVDIIVSDSRVESLSTGFTFPDIDRDGTGNGISGDASIVLDNIAFSFCCLDLDSEEICMEFPDFPEDEVIYTIQVRDRAGNFSNIIQTEPITVLCR
ncbi:MAG: hypothetical protein AAGF87_03850 [Bacteroidota bacterium]